MTYGGINNKVATVAAAELHKRISVGTAVMTRSTATCCQPVTRRLSTVSKRPMPVGGLPPTTKSPYIGPPRFKTTLIELISGVLRPPITTADGAEDRKPTGNETRRLQSRASHTTESPHPSHPPALPHLHSAFRVSPRRPSAGLAGRQKH
jgi:hypothetical protein